MARLVRWTVLIRTLTVSMLSIFALAACQPGARPAPGPERTLARFPAQSLDGVVARSQVALDAEVTADGNGSLRIDASRPTTVQLWVAEETDVDDALLFYRARLRSEGLEGRAYLEMWAHFPGKGEFFSRGLDSAITGSSDWSRQETPFLLETGQRPDYVKLNLAVEGTGTVWIDDAMLVAAPRS